MPSGLVEWCRAMGGLGRGGALRGLPVDLAHLQHVGGETGAFRVYDEKWSNNLDIIEQPNNFLIKYQKYLEEEWETLPETYLAV